MSIVLLTLPLQVGVCTYMLFRSVSYHLLISIKVGKMVHCFIELSSTSILLVSIDTRVIISYRSMCLCMCLSVEEAKWKNLDEINKVIKVKMRHLNIITFNPTNFFQQFITNDLAELHFMFASKTLCKVHSRLHITHYTYSAAECIQILPLRTSFPFDGLQLL